MVQWKLKTLIEEKHFKIGFDLKSSRFFLTNEVNPENQVVVSEEFTLRPYLGTNTQHGFNTPRLEGKGTSIFGLTWINLDAFPFPKI